MGRNDREDSDPMKPIDSAELKPRNYKDTKCAPALKFEDGACMPVDLMVHLAKAYNAECEAGGISGSPIKLLDDLDTLNPKKYKRYLVKKFTERLNSVCDNQRCWIKQNFTKKLTPQIKKYLRKRVWRPTGPEGQFEWLNTLHIENVMKQHEDMDTAFHFYGAVPMDFDSLNLEASRLDPKKEVAKGRTKLGVIFNLDEHWQSGSHWVASFADLKKGEVYYFDSYGERPEARVRKYMRRLAKYYKDTTGKKARVDYNKVQHQFGGTECGVYSINFIERMLNGDSFDQIVKDKTDDETINEMRNKYFIGQY